MKIPPGRPLGAVWLRDWYMFGSFRRCGRSAHISASWKSTTPVYLGVSAVVLVAAPRGLSAAGAPCGTAGALWRSSAASSARQVIGIAACPHKVHIATSLLVSAFSRQTRSVVRAGYFHEVGASTSSSSAHTLQWLCVPPLLRALIPARGASPTPSVQTLGVSMEAQHVRRQRQRGVCEDSSE